MKADGQVKKYYLLLIALAAGFIWAFLAAGVHSVFFALLPVLAFAIGYCSTWWRGLLAGILLFLGYTFATALMWFGGGPNLVYPLQYIFTFALGGFSLPLIGALAPLVKRGIKKFGPVAVLVVVAIVMVWCGFQARPVYSDYYQVIVHTSQDVDDLELYLPPPYVSGGIDEGLLAGYFDDPMAPLTKNYTQELVETEYGPMLKLTFPELMSEGPPGYQHTANIIFWEPGRSSNNFLAILLPWLRDSAPHEITRLMPRYDVTQVDRVESRRYVGPVKVKESRVVEEFSVPVVVKCGTDVDFELRLENRTGWSRWINFTYSKSNTYTELIRYNGSTGNEWLLVPVEVTERLDIRGVGD